MAEHGQSAGEAPHSRCTQASCRTAEKLQKVLALQFKTTRHVARWSPGQRIGPCLHDVARTGVAIALAPERHTLMGPRHSRVVVAIGGLGSPLGGTRARMEDIEGLGVAHGAMPTLARIGATSNRLGRWRRHLGKHRWDGLLPATAAEVADELGQTVAHDRARATGGRWRRVSSHELLHAQGGAVGKTARNVRFSKRRGPMFGEEGYHISPSKWVCSEALVPANSTLNGCAAPLGLCGDVGSAIWSLWVRAFFLDRTEPPYVYSPLFARERTARGT